MTDSSSRGRKGPTAVASVAGLLLAAGAAYLGLYGFDSFGGSGGVASGSDTCAMETLPDEAHDTAADIQAGGPYQFPENDNTRFGNYEGVLPDEELGYYREYTVVTPGLDHRGERRIVTGGGTETDPEVWYYTDDHYESFCEIPDAET
ncbi:ribonuclease [Corynebacterium yudongzhengii]|uniref:Ribonuclease n=1 Tax=Corynebacterium yudongzhengii TaxID=2080740 RepID=A0A2U1T7T0_9CORY|nr:ribonuclease domain-containing protein [Corynebacterium yudongzhengii]AWB81481.1 ribonuclease [Corynebacterium yudongzhengii]PWC01948.1 ribonuclease [Corynebacterium yudongzhengii]